MFPNYSGWFGLWSLVHLLDMFGDTIVHLEGTLFVLLCTPFCMFMCYNHISYVKAWCLKFVVTPLFISKAHSLSSCVHHFLWLCVNHILYMWKCGAWNLWWHHGSFGEHTVEQHGVHILPRRACLIVQLATTKIVADCTLKPHTTCVYTIACLVGLCVCLLLLEGVFILRIAFMIYV